MKYWNKKKKIREHWTCIRVDTYFPEAKVWCQQHPGKGKFYSGPFIDKWYFEFSEDALAFKLKYGYR